MVYFDFMIYSKVDQQNNSIKKCILWLCIAILTQKRETSLVICEKKEQQTMVKS